MTNDKMFIIHFSDYRRVSGVSGVKIPVYPFESINWTDTDLCST